MATAHEIRELIAQTTTGTHRQHLPREVRERIRRYAERRRTRGATWQTEDLQRFRSPPRSPRTLVGGGFGRPPKGSKPPRGQRRALQTQQGRGGSSRRQSVGRAPL
jgi:hypothetical protein